MDDPRNRTPFTTPCTSLRRGQDPPCAASFHCRSLDKQAARSQSIERRHKKRILAKVKPNRLIQLSRPSVRRADFQHHRNRIEWPLAAKEVEELPRDAAPS